MAQWLEGRLASVPPSLRDRLLQALATHGSDLQVTANALLEQAKRGGSDRETALTLLAADALVTFACELAAETAPERLDQLR